MSSYIKLCIAAALPAVAAVLLKIIEKKYQMQVKQRGKLWQLACGMVFGGLAVVGTEWGIPINGAQINCRDAAVLTGGLLFGAPAGIIAGLIGGIERWIAVAWGVGTYTRTACSVSTIIAGFYAAGLRKYLFESKKPGFLISFCVGIVIEVFHLTMVFMTNMDTPTQAVSVVQACSAPMITANASAVALSSLVADFFSGESNKKRTEKPRIYMIIQRRMLIAVLAAFSLTTVFVWNLQTRMAVTQADSLLDIALNESCADLRAETQRLGGGLGEIHAPEILTNRTVGSTGSIILADNRGAGISSFSEMPRENTTYKVMYRGEENYCRWRRLMDRCVFAMLPEAEVMSTRNIVMYVNTYIEIMIFALLFVFIYLIIEYAVVRHIKSINASLGRITEGKLEETVEVRGTEEFSELSDGINTTVGTLKEYIKEASARIDRELETARKIQKAALPGVFPKRKEFEIYASMDAAKVVGGDFYDFYFTRMNYLNFLIADVSGKGIPGAMFMMQSKAELKSFAETDIPLNEVFNSANEALCEANEAEMFITAWQGCLDIDTGILRYVNAGHNPPLIKKAGGKFEYLRSRPGFVLAGLKEYKYRLQELELEPGDVVFLYTDGVTEAVNINEELFGEDRLKEALNEKNYVSVKELLERVRARVDAFADGAPQADDMTMLALYYAGSRRIPSVRFENCALSDISEITAMVEKELEKAGCAMKTVTQIDVAVDEIYSNIVNYAYPGGTGPAEVKMRFDEENRTVSLKFSDSGIPYNPLMNDDPDTGLPIEERKIGGLGIFIVKKTMDNVEYRRENGQNILIITKRY